MDGDYNGFDPRTATVAGQMLDLLRDPEHGTDIEELYVTFNRPGGTRLTCEGGAHDANHSAFWQAIQNQQVPENIRASRKKELSMAEAAAVSPPDLRRTARRGLAIVATSTYASSRTDGGREGRSC